MSLRTEQVESLLLRSVQQVIARGLNDPRVRGLVSVTRVRVSTDLREATVHVSILPEEHAATSMHGLRSAVPYVQSKLRELVALRRVPRLSFKLDRSLKKEAEVHAAIARARGDDAPTGEHPEADGRRKGPAS